MKPLRDDQPREIGPYRVLAELGEGGMGRVLLAAAGDGQLVALKVMRPELAATLKERGYDLWIGEPALLVERAAQERAMWATVTKDITID